MKNFRENIWEEGEYNYEAAYGFEPFIYAYMHEDEEVHPCLLVVPGGGYCMVCNTEGEPMAKVGFREGMNVFVLTYTTDITMSVPLKRQPMNDLSRAIRYIRANSERFHIDPTKLTICGSSAGGHVCASVMTHFKDIKDHNPKYENVSNRPDSGILCYPVITAGEFTHIYSIWALLGKDARKEELDYFSLEKQVTEDTPPCFVWQTVEDDLVPVENSMMYAQALREKKIPYAYFAFPHGHHGLSVHDDDTKNGVFGEPYTFEQVDKAIENVKNNTAVNVSKERHDELMIQFFGNVDGIKEEKPDGEAPAPFVWPTFDDVSYWPTLCTIWLKSMNML